MTWQGHRDPRTQMYLTVVCQTSMVHGMHCAGPSTSNKTTVPYFFIIEYTHKDNGYPKVIDVKSQMSKPQFLFILLISL